MMNKKLVWSFALVNLFTLISLIGQNRNDSIAKVVDDNLTFGVLQEDIRETGTIRVCITDTSGFCISNLQSGFVIRVYNKNGEELYAGKTAGREETLRFPQPIADAAYMTLTAFKPYVLNKYTGSYIYQSEPIHIKYDLE